MNQPQESRFCAGRPPTSRSLAWLAALTLIVISGCKHGPAKVHPHDPFPGDGMGWIAADQDSMGLHQRIELLAETTDTLAQRLDEMDRTLAARNAELIQTRNEHQRSIQDIREVRTEMQRWQESLSQLHERLAEQEKQRDQTMEDINQLLESLGEKATADSSASASRGEIQAGR